MRFCGERKREEVSVLKHWSLNLSPTLQCISLISKGIFHHGFPCTRMTHNFMSQQALLNQNKTPHQMKQDKMYASKPPLQTTAEHLPPPAPSQTNTPPRFSASPPNSATESTRTSSPPTKSPSPTSPKNTYTSTTAHSTPSAPPPPSATPGAPSPSPSPSP